MKTSSKYLIGLAVAFVLIGVVTFLNRAQKSSLGLPPDPETEPSA